MGSRASKPFSVFDYIEMLVLAFVVLFAPVMVALNLIGVI